MDAPDYTQIRSAILRDVTAQNPKRNVGADSDLFVRSTAFGTAMEGIYQRQEWIIRQIFPDLADDDYVIKHAGYRGLTLKSATQAEGQVSISGGIAGSTLYMGAQGTLADGTVLVTTADIVLDETGDGTGTVRVQTAGAAGNQAEGLSLTWTAPPQTIPATATLGTLTGGTDQETVKSLLARLLFVMRNPPCGGADHDYYIWAMNVPGVIGAYVYPNRRYIGSVDVAIKTAGGIAPATLVAAVQAYIDGERPVQGNFLAMAPTPVLVNYSGTLALASGYDKATVGASINATLSGWYDGFAPGQSSSLNKAIALIQDTAGVTDFELALPAATTPARLDSTHCELCVLGSGAWQ